MSPIQNLRHLRPTFAVLVAFAAVVPYSLAGAPSEKEVAGPNGVRMVVKMIGPVTQSTDLQIICILNHDPAGDKYIGAMKDFNDRLGGLLSSLRDRGEFVGEAGETMTFTPPPNSITPARILMIGVGDESMLTLDRLRLVGRIAAREAVRLHCAHVAFAPGLRDQGSARIDVGEGDGVIAEQFLLAYDTEKRMQSEGLEPAFAIEDFTIEAGPAFFDAVSAKVAAAVESAQSEIALRSRSPFHVVESAK
jgi:hypothetical protein